MNEEHRMTEAQFRAAGRSNPPKPAPVRRKVGRWAITYGARRKARRANSLEASRKEVRFYRRHTRRRERCEELAKGLLRTFLARETEKERKRRIRRTGAPPMAANR